jgi:hypothetical protein
MVTPVGLGIKGVADESTFGGTIEYFRVMAVLNEDK